MNRKVEYRSKLDTSQALESVRPVLLPRQKLRTNVLIENQNQERGLPEVAIRQL